MLSGYGAAQLLIRRKSGWLLALYIVALTTAFVLLKGYAFLKLIPGDNLIAQGLDLIGLSFIFFRQIHYVVDTKEGEIQKLDLWAYLVYQLNPFTLFAGPIHRYQTFQEDWRSLTPRFADSHEVRMALLRILIGVIKVTIIAEIALHYATPGPYHGRMAYVVQFYLFPLYVYFNFAGYCDIVIAAASLVGIRLPENFDKPYLSRNMIDYWNRWHRSLSFWIRDYIFTPLYMAIARVNPKGAPNLAYLCYFVALFLAGVWHGATWNFVVFGFLNAIGVSAAKLWETIIIARGGRKGLREYLASTPILWAARLGTLHFVCLTMVFLRPGTEKIVFDLFSRVAG